MQDFDDVGFRAQLTAESGNEPPWEVPGFHDVHARMRQSLNEVRECLWIPFRDDIRGFIFDVGTARLEEVR